MTTSDKQLSAEQSRQVAETVREEIARRLPRVDLPEILLEVAARTDFAAKFTHVSERESRVDDLRTSVCAVLIAEACNIWI